MASISSSGELRPFGRERVATILAVNPGMQLQPEFEPVQISRRLAASTSSAGTPSAGIIRP